MLPSDLVFRNQLCRESAEELHKLARCEEEEQKAGNTEFDSAEKLTMQALKAMALPELDWFIENCLPAFSKDLDQL